MVALLLAVAVQLAVQVRAGEQALPPEACQPDKLTVYKAVMHTFWSRDRFPKHYPDWRPPAQWSKVIGRSHNASYTLFRLGQLASAGVSAFAETGHSELLDDESQGVGGVLDDFIAPPVHAGSGRTEAEFFVDGNHSRVSLMSRIVPSPDWFIGIDSFDLCVDGGWIDSITIEVDPIDAGTDNGFTFTAPNWPTEPQGVVYRITSSHPQHPASSFYYPFIKRLPPIATFQFIKVKEYELSEVFHHSEDEHHFDVFRLESRDSHPNSIAALSGEVQREMEGEQQEEERRMAASTTTATPTPPPPPPTQQLIEYTGWPGRSATVMPGQPAGSDSKATVVSSILQAYGSGSSLQDSFVPLTPATSAPSAPISDSRPQRRKHKTVRKIRAPRDCRVGEWGPWSECSKSCGIGEMQRRREIEKPPRRGGRGCPPLLETKWCGSARACAKGYFKW